MENTIKIIEVVISVLLVVAVLLQQKGASLGATFGGQSNIYHSKRGIEKFLYYATIVLSILFVVGAILNLYFSK